MTEEFSVHMPIALDDDGYLRRQCPTCESEFKWLHEENDWSPETVFCPRCGSEVETGDCTTSDQREYMLGQAAPQLDDYVNSMLDGMFSKASSRAVSFKKTGDVSIDIPRPPMPDEPNDMVAVAPPCHPAIPVKVPEAATSRVHCLACGSPFAA